MRALGDIDRDIDIERRLLEYEARNGRRSDGTCATWRHIDQLLDERLEAASAGPSAPLLEEATPSPGEGTPPSLEQTPTP